MKMNLIEKIDEYLTESFSGMQYAVVPIGGILVGGKPFKTTKDLKGQKIMNGHKVYSKDDAQERAKKLNKGPHSSKNEYIVVELKDGVFTGK